VPQAWYAKGNYFTLAGRSPFSRLIYPVPEAAGLGVHLTLDLGGQAKFGPDVQWVDSPMTWWWTRGAVTLLCRGAPLLARVAGRRAAAGLCRHAAQDQWARRAGRDFVIQGPQVHGVRAWSTCSASSHPG
jgi:L-2-hydroxyglutarate oxidase LhgO